MKCQCKRMNNNPEDNNNRKCFDCTITGQIKEVIPNITNQELCNIKTIIREHMQDAWNDGAQMAANDISSRI